MARGHPGQPDAGGSPLVPDALPFVYRIGLAGCVFVYVSLEGVAGGLLPFEGVAAGIAVYVLAVASTMLRAGGRGLTPRLHRDLVAIDMAALAFGLPHDPHHGLPGLFAYYLLFAEYGLRCGRRDYVLALGAGAAGLGAGLYLRLRFADTGFTASDAWSAIVFAAFAASGLIGVAARERTQNLSQDLERVRRDLDSRSVALRESEVRNAAVAESALDAIVGMDLDGRVSSWNPAAEGIFGYTEKQAIGQKLGDLIVPEGMREAHEAGLARHRRERRPSTLVGKRLEMPARRRDGARLDVELVIVATDFGGQRAFTGFLRDVTEQKLAAARLADSNARYRQLAEAMPIGLFTAEPDGRIDYVNETLVHATGRPVADWLGGGWHAQTHPDELEAAERATADARRTGQPIDLTTRERMSNGRYRTHLRRIVPIYDDRGTTVKWVGAWLDVEDVHRAKREIERYLFAVNAARVSSFTWNALTDHMEFDSLFEPLLGVPRGTLKDRFSDFLRIVHPDDREKLGAFVQNGFEGAGRDFRLEYRVPQADGGIRWIRGVGRILRDDDGQAIEAAGAIQDATVEIEAMLALERSRAEMERYLVAVEAARVAAYTYDAIQQRFEFDPLFEPVLGFDSGTFDGHMRTLLGIIHPDDREPLATYIASALAAGDDYSYECRTLSASQRVRWLRTSGRITRDDAGRPVRASGVAQDISVEVEILKSLEQRQKELERVNRELDDFTYIASHDLKEPLRGIHNFARFLQEDHGDKLDDEGRSMLATLGEQASRMQKLIDDLLHIARLGRQPLLREDVPLDPVVDDVLASLDFSIREKRARIQRPAPLPTLACDRVRVTELFRNLVVNALKYNAADVPTITITCDDTVTPAVLSVADNGIGIPTEHRERVFAPFKRLHARDAYGGGSGAGLTIVKKIVEAHDGRIWIDDAPRNGTTFHFTLEGGVRRA